MNEIRLPSAIGQTGRCPIAEVVETVLNWPATTQLTAHRFGVKLVSKYADWVGFSGYAVL
jgi:hypothetical protein